MTVTLQKKTLRQNLGLLRLNETTIGTTALSAGVGSFLNVMDVNWAVPDFSGMQLYQRSWVKVGSFNYRVGTFNSASGAWSGLTKLRAAIPAGADFEIHEKMWPDAMDAAIDETILTLPVRREVAFSTIDGALFYTLDGLASPHTIKSVLNAYIWTNPGSSLNRMRQDLTQEQIVVTGSGVELRVPYAVGASWQVVLDALLTLSMNALGDYGTITLHDTEGPTAEAILWGAAARCYDLLVARAQRGEDKDELIKRRQEAVGQFNIKSRSGLPQVARKIGFETAFENGYGLGIGY